MQLGDRFMRFVATVIIYVCFTFSIRQCLKMPCTKLKGKWKILLCMRNKENNSYYLSITYISSLKVYLSIFKKIGELACS